MRNNQNHQGGRTVVFTGGHGGTAALAVVREVRKRNLDWDVHWIGPKKSVEGKKISTIESKVFPKYGIHFHEIKAGKLQRKLSIHTLPSFLRLPLGFWYALKLILAIRPEVVLSFGGYAAVPVVVVAYILRIPVVLQEQITGLGLANRQTAIFAKKISLAREEGVLFARGKGVVTGLPINPDISHLRQKTKLKKTPTIFVFPGSRGSQIINKVVKDSLPKLLEDYRIIHQTGELDIDEFKKIRKQLSAKEKERYEVHSFIDYDMVPDFYRKSDILIGRAGANTASEIMAAGIPSVLIPLTWTNYKEQVLNAEIVRGTGLGVILQQDDLESGSLLKCVAHVKKNWKKMATKYDKTYHELDKTAASSVVDIVKKELS